MHLMGTSGLIRFAGIISIAFRIIDGRGGSKVENSIFTDDRNFSVETGDEMIGHSLIISTYYKITAVVERNGKFIISIL